MEPSFRGFPHVLMLPNGDNIIFNFWRCADFRASTTVLAVQEQNYVSTEYHHHVTLQATDMRDNTELDPRFICTKKEDKFCLHRS